MNNSDPNLTIIIKTPKGDWEQSFAKTTKIQQVIDAVVTRFGFSKEGKYDLRKEDDPDNPLDVQRPLVSFGIKDGDVLIFTDLGIGV